MHIKNQQDFWSGLMFIVIGLAFSLWSAQFYDLGTATHMGPGYFPFWLGIILSVIGAVISLSALLTKEVVDESHVSKFDFDILILILGSIVCFGLMLNNLGLYVSLVFLVLIGSMSSHEFSLKVAIGNSIFLLVFTWVAFVKGLGLVFVEWPLPFAEWDDPIFKWPNSLFGWSEPFAHWPTIPQILIPIVIVACVVMIFLKIKSAKGKTR